MLFFSHLRRVKARRLEIAELDKEISRLYATKSELEISVQKKESEFEILCSKKEIEICSLEDRIKKLNTFITLEEQIDKANQTLVLINTEVEEERNKLATLKNENSILHECVLANELLKKISTDLQNSIDNNLKKLLDAYPNIKPGKLFILNCFNGFKDNTIHFKDIEVAINTNLTKFAITHKIDPTLYKDLMYHFNDPWVKRFNELKGKYKSLNVKDYENDQLFNGFIVLVDNKN